MSSFNENEYVDTRNSGPQISRTLEAPSIPSAHSHGIQLVALRPENPMFRFSDELLLLWALRNEEVW